MSIFPKPQDRSTESCLVLIVQTSAAAWTFFTVSTSTEFGVFWYNVVSLLRCLRYLFLSPELDFLHFIVKILVNFYLVFQKNRLKEP